MSYGVGSIQIHDLLLVVRGEVELVDVGLVYLIVRQSRAQEASVQGLSLQVMALRHSCLMDTAVKAIGDCHSCDIVVETATIAGPISLAKLAISGGSLVVAGPA